MGDSARLSAYARSLASRIDERGMTVERMTERIATTADEIGVSYETLADAVAASYRAPSDRREGSSGR